MTQMKVELQNQFPDKTAIETGLLKKCPRCNRVGEVFMFNPQSDAEKRLPFAVVWPPKTGRPFDFDVALDMGDLCSSNMGCGHDWESRT